MIVIDVGCAKHGGDESIPDLVREFHPALLIGLDPAVEQHREYVLDGCRVSETPAAAWTYDGEVGFVVAGLGGHVDVTAAVVPCLDLAGLILDLARTDEVVAKLDCEGGEYTLLPHLIAHDADLALTLAIVEFHCEACGLGGNGRHREGCLGDHAAWDLRRAEMEAMMRCEIREWNR